MYKFMYIFFCVVFTHCGGDAISSDGGEEASYTVGGTVTGLSGTLVLQNNSGDNLSLTSNGDFTFSTAVADGAAYSVTVLTQPSGQTCTPTNNTGTVASTNITTVTVTCANLGTYTIGGTLTNLGANKSVILQNNGGNSLTPTSNGSFTFTTALVDGASYDVTASTQPTRQTCTVTSGSGTLSSANVTNVAVTCVTSSPRIFKTAVQFNGDLKTNGSGSTGIAGADALCMADSNYPGNGTYKALMMDGVNRVACTTSNCGGGVSEHTDWVLAASTTYLRSDDTTTIGTTTSAGIFSFPLTNAFSSTSNSIWTGLHANWTLATHHCDGTAAPWTSSLSSVLGKVGVSDSTASNAITDNNDQCNLLCNLYCVEQ